MTIKEKQKRKQLSNQKIEKMMINISKLISISEWQEFI